MKVKMILTTLFALGLFIQLNTAQEAKQASDVTVFPSVLSTAQWAGFKYTEQLQLAKTGDLKAVSSLLDFSGTVDGVDALNHAVTCLELLPFSTDLVFAAAVNKAKPKLKKVLLDRLVLAQGRTTNLELRKPLAEWAPLTWDVLNGKPFQPDMKGSEECMASKASQKNTASQMNAGSAAGASKPDTAPVETVKPKQ